MPLTSSLLAATIQANLLSQPKRVSLAAAQMAAAYSTYAALGLCGGGTLVIPPIPAISLEGSILGFGIPPAPILNPAGLLAVQLYLVMSAPKLATPATIAAAWATGVASFWPGITVAGPATGTITACAGAASLAGSLIPVFSNLQATPQTFAIQLSNVLDLATRTALGIVVIPPSPAPISSPLL